MASSNFILKGFNPATALASGTYVIVNPSGQADVPTALTSKVIGTVESAVTADDVVANRAVTVRLFGPTRIVAVTGAPITAGDSLYLATGGTLTNVSITGSQYVGVALQNAAANLDQIEVATTI